MWNWTLTYEYLKDNPYDVLSAFSPYTDYEILQGFYLARLGQADDFLFDDPSDDTIGPAVWVAKTYFPDGAIIIDSNGHKQTADRNANTGAVEPTWDMFGGITSDGTQRWQDGGAFNGATAQAIPLVDDGAGNWYSPLQRNFGGQFLEDITDINSTMNPFVIWANGVLQVPFPMSSPNYTIVGPGLAIPGYSFMGLVAAWNAPPTGPITAAGQFYFRTRFDMDSLDFEEFLYRVWTIGGSGSKNGAGYLKLTSSRAPGV